MYAYTPKPTIDAKFKTISDFYHNEYAKLNDIDWKLNQLRNLYFAIADNEKRLVQALQKDFHRSAHETVTFEVVGGLNMLSNMIHELPKWLAPTKVKEPGMVFMTSSVTVEKISLGKVLVISPFNFPLLLSLEPIAGAIACGNTVVFKGPESCPNFCTVFEEILSVLEPGLVEVVHGAVEETNRLLEFHWDKIFYTGAGFVGKIIAEKAAKTLTPTVLELGGKSPVIITPSVSNMETAITRVCFAAFSNAGQICISSDYVLCHESRYDEAIAMFKKVMAQMWTVDADSEYTHMIHSRAFKRVTGMLNDSTGDVVIGGKYNEENLFIEPTIVGNCSWNDSLLKDEIFGPVLPIIKYSDLDTELENIMRYHDTPLALYIYSNNKKEIKHIMQRIRSGAVSINDSVVHGGLSKAPFGGVGSSGYGNYRGEYSIRAFTHERTTLRQPFWNEIFMGIKYPPVGKNQTETAKKIMSLKPKFGRTGKVRGCHWLTPATAVAALAVAVGALFAVKKQ